MENPWEAGPPSNPIEFDNPRVDHGLRRDGVLCYHQELRPNNYERRDNVLFRVSDADGTLHRVEQAYWPIPTKPTITTIMGHVEFCLVLKRCVRDFNDGSRGIIVGGDEDIIFQVSNPVEYVAVKVNYRSKMDYYRDRHTEDPLKEIATMQLIGNSHPNVIGTLETLFDGTNLNVVMPYCDNGDLFDYQSTNGRMSEPVARYWFRQVMVGIQYLHSKGICHRDLSLENIMIDGKNSLIIDMGMCLRMPYTDPNAPLNVTDITRGTQRRLMNPQGRCGKNAYMSPEIYRNQEPFDGVAIDVWTAGTILYRMVTGYATYETPYDAHFEGVTRQLARMIRAFGPPLSDECVDLLQNMMQIHPQNRLTVEGVLNHRWLANNHQTP